MIRKIFIALMLFILSSWSVSAINPQEIQEQIKYALQILRQTQLNLQKLDPTLAHIFFTEYTNDKGHDAEVTIRTLYPKEYMEYLEAKSNLDDLLYTKYLIFANGKAE